MNPTQANAQDAPADVALVRKHVLTDLTDIITNFAPMPISIFLPDDRQKVALRLPDQNRAAVDDWVEILALPPANVANEGILYRTSGPCSLWDGWTVEIWCGIGDQS